MQTIVQNRQERGRLLGMAALTGAAFLLLSLLAWVISAYAAPSTVDTTPAALRISEYMSANRSAYPDESGAYWDWVELHNGGDTAFDLNGCTLSDGQNTWKLPNRTLAADAYLVIFLDGVGKTAMHAGFQLKTAGGEELSLQDQAGNTLDSVKTIALDDNTSAIRADDGFVKTARFTPGYANDEKGYQAYQASRATSQSRVVISEIMAENTVVYPDKAGLYHDYIEVQNISDTDLSLSGYGLTNDRDKPLKWRFPTVTLKAGESLLVYAAGRPAGAASDELYTGFRINRTSDTVFLCSSAGAVLDSVAVTNMEANVALVRGTDGTYTTSDTPSPGQPNTDAGIEAFWQVRDSRLPKGLCVNEILTRNMPKDAKSTADDFRNGSIGGKPYDWIELYNPTDKPIKLKGYHLTDDTELPGRFALPDIEIPAGGYQLIFCTGEPVTKNAKYIQANFKLNGGSGEVALIGPDGRIVDGMAYHNLPLGVSKGRGAQKPGYFYYTAPSPGRANPDTAARKLTATPAALTAAGVYNHVKDVTVRLAGPGTIHYTLDGSTPTADSPTYTDPLTLTKTTVVRAVCIEDGAVPADPLTASYIVNENHTLDVVSLATDPDNLYSESRGIYVEGPGASPEFPHTGANYWMDWEREAHIEFFTDGDAGFSLGCGIKVFGQYSRAYEKKSLSVFFRDCYGAAALTYPVFDNREALCYESLVLRSTGQDRMRALMKDALITSLADDAGVLDVQAYRPVILYVNGRYFGIYYIREKISEHFLAAHHNVSPDTIDLLQGNGFVNQGNNADYLALIQYVRSHDLRSKDAYQYVIDRIDPVSYCDFVIAQIYFGNEDTGNIRYFRSSQLDNKWRWILFDTDMGFRNYGIWYNINPKGTGSGQSFSTTLIAKLLQNDAFRALFLERFAYHMQHTFSTKTVLARIDTFATYLKPEIARNHTHYGITTSWEGNVEEMRAFVRTRQKALKQEMSTKAEVKAVFRLNGAQIDALFE